MKASIDGGVTFFDCGEIRVVYSGLNPDAPEVELHIQLTGEGMIADVVDANDGVVFATEAEMAADFIERMVGE